jgi:transposase
MADTDKLTRNEHRFVARLLADTPKLADAVAVAKRLHCILRKEGDEPLQEVFTAADDTLLAGFAASLGRDQDAVQAALDLPWTTSPVEGQVNRIKIIKRSMYGRADFDLLRACVL